MCLILQSLGPGICLALLCVLLLGRCFVRYELQQYVIQHYILHYKQVVCSSQLRKSRLDCNYKVPQVAMLFLFAKLRLPLLSFSNNFFNSTSSEIPTFSLTVFTMSLPAVFSLSAIFAISSLVLSCSFNSSISLFFEGDNLDVLATVFLALEASRFSR